jgi:hypothetical protein
VLHAGATKSVALLAQNGAGLWLPFHGLPGEVAWALDSAVGTVTPDANNVTLATVSGAATAGSGQLTAKLGSVTCTPASLTNFATPTAGQFRVVVASQIDQTLINDATVVVNGAMQANGVGGAYAFTSVSIPATVSVYRPGSVYVTMLGVSTSDVVVFLKPMGPPASVSGTVTPATFNDLSDIRGTVHVAASSAAIQGSLFDADPALLLGPPVMTHIDFGGATQTDTNLPSGVALGLGSQLFKGDATVFADPGTRAVWALGGNVVLSDVLGVRTGPIGDDSIDIGRTLAPLLPIVGRFQSSVTLAEFSSETPGTLALNLDTLLRLQTVVAIPTLPGVNAVLALAGARSPSQGFVPLGLTAGVDEHTGSSTTDRTPDGIIDPVGMNGTPGELPLRLAPLHDGLEGSPFEIVTLALNTSALFGGKAPLTLSARVLLPESILFKNNGTAANTFQVGAFLPIPDAAALDSAARTLTVSPVTGADLYRVDFAAGWQVYFPPSMSAVLLPTPPSGFDDRLASTATLRAVSLKLKAGVDYQSAVQFDGDNVDDLSAATDAFAVRAITR